MVGIVFGWVTGLTGVDAVGLKKHERKVCEIFRERGENRIQSGWLIQDIYSSLPQEIEIKIGWVVLRKP